MVKRVVPTDQVAHLWAHQSQSDARNGTNSVHFSGAVFYSYATPIARIMQTIAGNTVALISSHGHSMTTRGKHYPAVRRALHGHIHAFTVPFIGAPGGWNRPDSNNIDEVHAGNVAALTAGYNEHVARLLRRQSRIYDQAADPHAEVLQELESIAGTVGAYGVSFGVNTPGFDTAADAARINARFDALEAHKAREQRAAAKLRREAAEREKRAAAAADALAAWRAGNVYANHSLYGLPVALRIVGDEVQTTLGARVPLQAARDAYGFYRLMLADGKVPWQRKAEHRFLPVNLGPFTLDSIDADGNVRAGCHNISAAELARFGALIGA